MTATLPATDDRTAEVRPADRAPAPPTRSPFWPLIAMAVVAVVLLAFFGYSQIRPPITFGYFSHPPVYGVWRPVLDRLALLVVPGGLLLAGVGWLVTSSRRVPSWLSLAVLIGCAVLAAATVALVRGDWHELTRHMAKGSNSYAADLAFVDRFGLRGFVERHPDLVGDFRSYHSKTHPPGVHLLLFGIFRIVGAAHPLRISTVIAVLALSAAVATWSIGRTLGGERAGRIGALLFVAAPGPLMLAYTSLDAVFATVLTTAVALFMIAVYRRSALVAAVAGGVLGFGTLLTYATSFVALAVIIAVVVQIRELRGTVRLLGAAAAGGLAALTLGRLLFGFDIVASYLAVPAAHRSYDPYWAVASPAAWLIYAGLPLAALGVVGLFRKMPDARRPVLPFVLVLVMVVWAALPAEVTRLRPGEVERTWAFLYPLVAASAGVVVDRWIRGRRWSGVIVPGLVALSVAQAVLLQSLWDTLF